MASLAQLSQGLPSADLSPRLPWGARCSPHGEEPVGGCLCSPATLWGAQAFLSTSLPFGDRELLGGQGPYLSQPFTLPAHWAHKSLSSACTKKPLWEGNSAP